MNVKIKVRLIILFLVVVTAFITFLIYSNDQQLGDSLQEQSLNYEIAGDVFELNLRTVDYLSTRGERAKVQWLVVYDQLGVSIELRKAEEEKEEKEEKRQSDEQILVDKIDSGYKSIKPLFNALVENYEGEPEKRSSKYEEILRRRLIIKAQEIISDAKILAQEEEEEIAIQRKLFQSFSMVLMIILTVNLVFVLLYLERSITKPLNKLSHGAEAIGKGNFAHRVNIKTKDEFKDLSTSFNQMASTLQKSKKEWEQLPLRLKKEVKQRTKELESSKRILQKRVLELEEWQNLTVGRELRIEELVKKVQKLESRLGVTPTEKGLEDIKQEKLKTKKKRKKVTRNSKKKR